MKQKNTALKESIWRSQDQAFRDPMEILASPSLYQGVTKYSFKYELHGEFIELLSKLNITLFISREYEHLVMAMYAKEGKLYWSYLPLPHPAGLVINRRTNALYVASTRNPNQIYEFLPINRHLTRSDNPIENSIPYYMPARTVFFPGAYYIHDLAIIRDELFANSVGQNCIVKIDFQSKEMNQPVWWPQCIEKSDGTPDFSANYIQLNSIAAGDSLEDSYFTSSGHKPNKRRKPGHLNYPVDKRGVIFFGKTRSICATGLTRPHSARLYKNKLWVDNSGYGEFGYVEEGKLRVLQKLPGWTRGLCIIDDLAFVGVSRVLPRFTAYAPGLNTSYQSCGIVVINIKTGSVQGSIQWPYGNQIFAIDYVDKNISPGFPCTHIKMSKSEQKRLFYSYMI